MSYRTKGRPRPGEEIGLTPIFFLLTIFVGVALALILGKDFVFHYAEQYKENGWIAFLVLLPVITLALLASPRGKLWRSRLTWARFLKQLIGWVPGIALLAGAIALSPLGYIAMLNEVVGFDTVVNAEVLSVYDDVPRRKTGRQDRCPRGAVILVEGKQIGMCLIDHYKPNDDIEGGKVLLQIRRSPFGYSIGQMTLAPR